MLIGFNYELAKEIERERLITAKRARQLQQLQSTAASRLKSGKKRGEANKRSK